MTLQLTTGAASTVIQRATWPTVVGVAVAGLASVAGGVGFYFVGAAGHPAAGVFYTFAAAFVLAGAALLSRLPGQARKAMQEGGIRHLVVDRSGVGYTPNLGSTTLALAWAEIAEIVLAESFELVEADERGSEDCVVLVLLQPTVLERTSFVERVGAGIGRSGTGRPYIAANYPRGKRDAVLHALRRWQPAGGSVQAWKRVTFDRKRQVDATEGKRG